MRDPRLPFGGLQAYLLISEPVERGRPGLCHLVRTTLVMYVDIVIGDGTLVANLGSFCASLTCQQLPYHRRANAGEVMTLPKLCVSNTYVAIHVPYLGKVSILCT